MSAIAECPRLGCSQKPYTHIKHTRGDYPESWRIRAMWRCTIHSTQAHFLLILHWKEEHWLYVADINAYLSSWQIAQGLYFASTRMRVHPKSMCLSPYPSLFCHAENAIVHTNIWVYMPTWETDASPQSLSATNSGSLDGREPRKLWIFQ